MSFFNWFSKVENIKEEAIEEIQEVAKEASEEIEEIKKEVVKEGWLYVISNRGSFGPGIYKIGATRKQNPEDRVRELGDASVPFKFDVHAFIKSDDVFGLEAQVHRFLKDYELNKVNHRKEFYKVDLEIVKDIIRKLGYKPRWNDEAPAIEFERSKNL
jgi:hypothetical protein